VRRKEKIERVRQVAQILVEPQIGDRIRVLECTIPEHRSRHAPCYSLFQGMIGQERIIMKTMMYTFPNGSASVQIWLTYLAGHPPGWWLTRHQFEILDG
jgi:hypothetical protein